MCFMNQDFIYSGFVWWVKIVDYMVGCQCVVKWCVCVVRGWIGRMCGIFLVWVLFWLFRSGWWCYWQGYEVLFCSGFFYEGVMYDLYIEWMSGIEM